MNGAWEPCRFSYFGFSHWQVFRWESEKPLHLPVERVFGMGIFETEEQAQSYANELNRREIVEAVQLYGMVKRKGEQTHEEYRKDG